MNESNSDANGKSLPVNCLCGAITFTVTAKCGEAGACHCKMCRRWSGGVLLSLQSTRGLQIDGEENPALYKSSDWGEYCFYKICGSNLFWHTQFQGHVSVMVGALNEEDQLTLTS